MRISDWSSDVCSSDLLRADAAEATDTHGREVLRYRAEGAYRARQARAAMEWLHAGRDRVSARLRRAEHLRSRVLARHNADPAGVPAGQPQALKRCCPPRATASRIIPPVGHDSAHRAHGIADNPDMPGPADTGEHIRLTN